jgi:hypothetical protein
VILWLALFTWTLALELPVMAWALSGLAFPWWRVTLIVLALNLLTHPLFTWWQLEYGPSEGQVFQAELAIVAVEGLALAAMLRQPRSPLPWLAALAANGVSYGVGGWLVRMFS